MKTTKKILFGAVAAVAMLGFVGCGGGDDTKGAIKGAGSSYTVNYANEDSSEYRAYKKTSLKHAGALVKVSFAETDNEIMGTSKMGVIFNLEENKTNDSKAFYIIGLSATDSGKNFYVSKYSNVIDIQEENFGTKLTENKAEEDIIVDITRNEKIAEAFTKNGYVHVYYKARKDGTFDYAVLKMTDDEAKQMSDQMKKNEDSDGYNDPLVLNNGLVLVKGNTGITEDFAITDANTKIGASFAQAPIAVYARIDKGTTLEGSWKFVGTYLEAEDAE